MTSTQRTSAASAARRQRTRAPRSTTAQSTHIKPADPIAELITSWRPHNLERNRAWDQIGPTVVDLVTAATPGGKSMAMKYLTAATHLVWARNAADMRIDDQLELLSDASLAAVFGEQVDSALLAGTRRTYLTCLRRMRGRIYPDTYAFRSPATVVGRSQVAQPYTAAELAALMGLCRANQRAGAGHLHAALLLGVACGLDGYEAPSITGTDIAVSPWGLVVAAHGAAPTRGPARAERWVPVLATWESELAAVAAKADNGLLLGDRAKQRRTTADLNGPTSGRVPAYSAARARATWMRALLEAGVGYVAMATAGVSVLRDSTLHTLADGITLPFDEYVSTVRAGNTPFQASAFPELRQWVAA